VGFDPYADIDAALAGCASDDPSARLIHRYCKLYMAGQNLANADRASMAWAWSCARRSSITPSSSS